MGDGDNVDEKMDFLQKEIDHNTKLIDTLRNVYHVMHENGETLPENVSLENLDAVHRKKSESQKDKIREVLEALENNPEALATFKDIIHEKNSDIYKIGKALSAYHERQKNYDEMKKQLLELSSSVTHFRSQFNSLKTEIKKKSDAIFDSESEISKLHTLLENSKRYNEMLIKHIVVQDKLLKSLKSTKYNYSNQEQNRHLLRKKILENSIEIRNLRKRERSLKELLDKKNNQITSHVDTMKEKENKISLLSEQQDMIRQGIKASDLSNQKLLKRIEELEDNITQMKKREESFEDEKQKLEEHYKMLLSLNEKSTHKRLREMAEAESKKEVLLNMKINELKSVVDKQKEEIDKRSKVLKDLASFASASMSEDGRSNANAYFLDQDSYDTVDYSRLDKEISKLENEFQKEKVQEKKAYKPNIQEIKKELQKTMEEEKKEQMSKPRLKKEKALDEHDILEELPQPPKSKKENKDDGLFDVLPEPPSNKVV